MDVVLGPTPVEVYAATGFVGEIDIQTPSPFRVYVLAGGTAGSPKEDYNVLDEWRAVNDSTLMAYSYRPGARLIVNQR